MCCKWFPSSWWLAFSPPEFFWCTHFLNFYKVQIINLSLYGLYFLCLFKESFPTPRSERYPPIFFYWVFQSLLLTFKSVIHLELISEYGVRAGSKFIFFSKWTTNFSSSFYWIIPLFSTEMPSLSPLINGPHMHGSISGLSGVHVFTPAVWYFGKSPGLRLKRCGHLEPTEFEQVAWLFCSVFSFCNTQRTIPSSSGGCKDERAVSASVLKTIKYL